MADLPAGQRMWLAFANELEVVTIVAKGDGGRVLKNKVKKPYLVEDENGDKFVVSYDDLCDSRLCAHRKQLELREEYPDAWEDDEEDDDFDEDDGDE